VILDSQSRGRAHLARRPALTIAWDFGASLASIRTLSWRLSKLWRRRGERKRCDTKRSAISRSRRILRRTSDPP